MEADYRSGADGKHDLELYLATTPAMAEGFVVRRGRDWRGGDVATSGGGDRASQNSGFLSLFQVDRPFFLRGLALSFLLASL